MTSTRQRDRPCPRFKPPRTLGSTTGSQRARQARLASVRAEPGRGNAPCWRPARRCRGPTFTNGNSAMELWQSDTEALPLTWDLVDPFPTVYELGDGEHRYASLRRPPREGWLWNWEWIAETATS